MAELIRKPHLLKKVRAAVGNNKHRVQPDDLPKLRYLKLVLKETLRLHPAAVTLRSGSQGEHAARQDLRIRRACQDEDLLPGLRSAHFELLPFSAPDGGSAPA